jgi:post-segregation antitoxin (ccd killing protein)
MALRITVDEESARRLECLARSRGVGVSTHARRLLLDAMERQLHERWPEPAELPS